MRRSSKFFATAILVCSFSSPSFADDRLVLEGEYVQGSTVRGKVPPGSTVALDGSVLRISEAGDFIFGFDRDHGSSSSFSVTFPDGTTEERSFEIASREYNIQRIDGLPPSQVTPRTKEQIAHIQRDQKMKKDARLNPALTTYFTEEFVWPLTGPISGFYGSQRILNGEPRRPHYGVDIAAPAGTDFFAPASGVVTLAAEDMYFEGGLIFLDHGHGYTSAFLHMERVDVKPGDIVQQGDLLGGVGSAGRSTGPHLDWRITWRGKQLDPTFLVGPMPTPDEEGDATAIGGE